MKSDRREYPLTVLDLHCQNLKPWIKKQLLFILFLSCEIAPSQIMSKKRRTGSNLKFWRGTIQRVCFLDVSQASIAFMRKEKRQGASLIQTFPGQRWHSRECAGEETVTGVYQYLTPEQAIQLSRHCATPQQSAAMCPSAPHAASQLGAWGMNE